MRIMRLIPLSMGVTASLLSLCLSHITIAGDEPEKFEAEGAGPETGEQKKTSRFSRFKSKVAKSDVGKAITATSKAVSNAADNSAIVQTGKELARQTGEITKAQSAKEAAKAIGKAGLDFGVQVGTAPTRAGIRAGKAAVEEVAKRVSRAPKVEPISNFQKIGKKPGGSVAGAKYKNTKNGKEYIIKYTPEGVANNEILAAAFYKKSGLNIPNFILVDPGESLDSYNVDLTFFEKIPPHRFIGVEFINGLKPLTAEEQSQRDDILNGFIIDCWLANYDVIGLESDNILADPRSNAIRVDIGASLERRAQGAPKLYGFNDRVEEINFLRNRCDADCMKSLNFSRTQKGIKPVAAQVFGKLEWKHIEHGLGLLKKFTNNVIKNIVQKHGTMDQEAKNHLINTLIARKETIMKEWRPQLEKEYKH